MCGIAGQYCFNGREPDGRLISLMSERLSHRGPDGEGIHLSNSTGLVHRRLAIIDLSDNAHQPMTNEDGTLWLVFNGEIYNYIELHEDLVRKGHRFQSKSDTEVILHAYEEWGTDCLNHFNGMWAFALIDEKSGTLFCARDRFGIKPFYYTLVDNTFLFASEIKALLVHPDVGKSPDLTTLGTYLAWGVLDYSHRTMFDGILQLKPAHAILIGKEGIGAPFPYWSVEICSDCQSVVSDKDVAAKLLSLLYDATRVHLRSDVAVGTCLSGGIDSSTLMVLINSLIREESPANVGTHQKTFSAVFSDKRFDESRYIDEIIASTRVNNRRTEPLPEELWNDIDHLVYMQDEPFGSLSIYAQYCVMRIAHEEVKVVLDGQGADELLAGYLAYQGSYIGGLLRTFHWWTACYEMFGSIRHHPGFLGSSLRQLLVRKGRRKLLKGNPEEINRYGGSLSDVLHRELTTTNLPSLLHYEDRNSMAFSIEARVPYLDVRVVEYIASLPLRQKIQNGVTKVSLRRAIKGIIPESIRCRMDKMGFVTPEEVWMRESLRPFILKILNSSDFHKRPFWEADAVVKDYLKFLEGSSLYSPEIWRIICTELWLQKFFDHRDKLPGNNHLNPAGAV
jgi:asparagine synthase (glutamine-hydrolysing)